MSLTRAEDAYIVLVEDDPNSYLIVEDLLKHAGFRHFYHRSSGAKLMQLVEALPRVDLILLGAEHKSASGEYTMGHVTQYVVKSAPCSVWLWRHPVHE